MKDIYQQSLRKIRTHTAEVQDLLKQAMELELSVYEGQIISLSMKEKKQQIKKMADFSKKLTAYIDNPNFLSQELLAALYIMRGQVNFKRNLIKHCIREQFIAADLDLIVDDLSTALAFQPLAYRYYMQRYICLVWLERNLGIDRFKDIIRSDQTWIAKFYPDSAIRFNFSLQLGYLWNTGKNFLWSVAKSLINYIKSGPNSFRYTFPPILSSTLLEPKYLPKAEDIWQYPKHIEKFSQPVSQSNSITQTQQNALAGKNTKRSSAKKYKPTHKINFFGKSISKRVNKLFVHKSNYIACKFAVKNTEKPAHKIYVAPPAGKITVAFNGNLAYPFKAKAIPFDVHMLTADQLPADIIAILRQFKQNKFKSGIIGGATRDLLSGEIPHDYDLRTDARPEDIIRIFPQAKKISARFETFSLEFGNTKVQISSFRSLRSKPFKPVYSHSPTEDAWTRDLTINTLEIELEEEEQKSTLKVTDYGNGLEDLKNKKLTFVCEKKDVDSIAARLIEDPVKLLRAFYFLGKLKDFSFDDLSVEAIRKVEKTPVFQGIHPETLLSEIFKSLSLPKESRKIYLKQLQEFDLLENLFVQIQKKFNGKINLKEVFLQIINSDNLVEIQQKAVAANDEIILKMLAVAAGEKSYNQVMSEFFAVKKPSDQYAKTFFPPSPFNARKSHFLNSHGVVLPEVRKKQYTCRI